MENKWRGTTEMTASMAILGTIGWFVVESGVPTLGVVFWRCALGAVTLLAICLALGHLRPLPSRRVLLLAGLGGVAIVLNWLLLFAAFSRASISMATAVYNTQPFLLVLFGALFLSERLTASKLFWLIVAFAGLVLVVQAKPGPGAFDTRYLLGIAMALAAAFFWAIAAILARKLAGTPPHLIALIHVLVGTAMLAPLQFAVGLPTGARAWSLLAVVGVVHTGLVYILMYSAIQKLPTHLQASLSFVYPVVAIVVDRIAFDRHLDGLQIVGALAILLAAAGMNLGWSLPALRRRASAAPVEDAYPQVGCSCRR
jgi:drug/metabolite transporter (DMT)-like permease